MRRSDCCNRFSSAVTPPFLSNVELNNSCVGEGVDQPAWLIISQVTEILVTGMDGRRLREANSDQLFRG
jgi:hypothetical protein